MQHHARLDLGRARSLDAGELLVEGLFGGEVSPSDRGHAGAGGFAGDLLAIDPLDGEPQELSVVAPAEAALRELKWQAQQLRSQMTAAAAEEDFQSLLGGPAQRFKASIEKVDDLGIGEGIDKLIDP